VSSGARDGGSRIKEDPGVDESWSRFWDHLIGNFVAILVLAFGIQGLWFGLVRVVAGPGTDAGGLLGRVSELFFVPFHGGGWPSAGGAAVILGLLWAVKRAIDARNEFLGRR
jgi:hypothetical protein